MYCRFCGQENDDPGRPCPSCGRADSEMPTGRSVPREPAPPVRPLARCPACGFHGQGVPYFRRTSHVFLLIGATVFTYGVGGLLYWLVKRRARVCPNCGLDWDRASRAPSAPFELSSGEPVVEGEGLPSPGGTRRVVGVGTLLVAMLLALIGIVDGVDAVLLAVGGTLAGAGAVTFWWGWNSMQARREELMSRLQSQALRLAARQGGRLTVTEVAHELDLSLPAAERILVSMEDGFRVRSEVTKQGLLLFEFPELLHPGGAPSPGGEEAGRELPR